MPTNEADARAEGRREAAPAALVVILVYALLAVVSWRKSWEIVGLPWWIWLVVGLPALLLAIDLVLARRGRGIVQSRHAALVLLSLLVAGNFIGLTVLVAGLVTQSTSSLTGGELLLTGFAIYTADVIVFGLIYWELEAGGPVARRMAEVRRSFDFQFPAGRESRARGVRLASTGLGLPLRLADELDRVQPHRHDAALDAREGGDGTRIGDLGGDGAARCRACGERPRLVAAREVIIVP